MSFWRYSRLPSLSLSISPFSLMDIYGDADLVELLEPGYVIVAGREVDVLIAILVLNT
jgi:hypothetical protein